MKSQTIFENTLLKWEEGGPDTANELTEKSLSLSCSQEDQNFQRIVEEDEDVDWPEWVEEIFDNEEPLKEVKKRFSWKFIEE
jgi:hypothetical protein